MNRNRFAALTFCICLILVVLTVVSLCDKSYSVLAVVFSTLLIGVMTVYVIYLQTSLIKRQIQFQTYFDFEKEWNDLEMLQARAAIASSPDKPNFPVLETILEFFEKFALFKKRDAMDMDFILFSTLGWYAVRYYFYHRANIKQLNERHGGGIYGNLHDFYTDYTRHECGDAWGSIVPQKLRVFEATMNDARQAFLEGESEN